MQAARAAAFALPLLSALVWPWPCVAQCDQFQAHARAEAERYEIHADSPSGRKLLLRAEPILRWTNPVPEKQMHGDVFLWTDAGRPAAVLCLFEMTEAGGVHEYHEFTSLAAGPLVTASTGDRTWSPAAGQVAMAPVPSTAPPGATPRQRLSQMRELATRFACEKTNRMSQTHALRLLSQPVARYESPAHKVSDGALFAFVEATDPEVFLTLEARSVDDASQWHYALARMASVRMQVSLDNKPVWEVDMLPYDGYRNRPDLPYTLLFVR